MTRMNFASSIFVLVSSAVGAQDPAVTDPDKYKVILENERTRVLDYKDHPGDRTTQHKHPDSVLYSLSNFKRRLTFPGRKSVIKEFNAGDVMFIPAQVHIGENIGKTDTHVLLVEFKDPQASAKLPIH